MISAKSCGVAKLRTADPPRRQGPFVERFRSGIRAEALGDRRLRIRQTAGAGVGRGEHNPKIADRRRIVAGAFESFDGLRGVALKEKDETGNFPVDGREIGVEPQRRLDGRGCLGMIAGEQLDISQRYLRLGISGAERDGALGRGDRFLVAAIHDLHDAENGVRR